MHLLLVTVLRVLNAFDNDVAQVLRVDWQEVHLHSEAHCSLACRGCSQVWHKGRPCSGVLQYSSRLVSIPVLVQELRRFSVRLLCQRSKQLLAHPESL